MRRYFYPLGIAILMLVDIYLIGKVHWEIEAILQGMPSTSLFSPLAFAVMKMSLLGVVFGMLINWIGIKTIYSRKLVRPNLISLLAVNTFILALIPNYFWIMWFGLGSEGLMGIPSALGTREVHMLISVLSGFLIIQSLTPEKD